MAKPRLSKELFQMGLTPRHFEDLLAQGFRSGADITALRELLQMTPEAFAKAFGIPDELLATLEASPEPPSAKFTRRLIKACEEPGAFVCMD